MNETQFIKSHAESQESSDCIETLDEMEDISLGTNDEAGAESDTDPLKIFSLNESIPSRIAHTTRNFYQVYPTGILKSVGGKIYYDEGGREWFRVPWYLNMFHNPARNIKLIHFDYHEKKGALGSSEIIVKKSKIRHGPERTQNINTSDVDLTLGSYNYRDMYVTSHWQHFLADVLPNVLYL